MVEPNLRDFPRKSDAHQWIIVRHGGVTFRLKRCRMDAYKCISHEGKDRPNFRHMPAATRVGRVYEINKHITSINQGSHSLAIWIGILRLHNPEYMHAVERYWQSRRGSSGIVLAQLPTIYSEVTEATPR